MLKGTAGFLSYLYVYKPLCSGWAPSGDSSTLLLCPCPGAQEGRTVQRGSLAAPFGGLLSYSPLPFVLIVFLLWGGYAKQKLKLIDETKHYILTSGHPSPLSANRGYWFGNKHFSKCNSYLKEVGKNEINWSLD